MRNDQISALERLMNLKDAGGLTDEEFQTQKEKILNGEIPAGQAVGSQPQASDSPPSQRPPDVPFYRRRWVVTVLALSLIGLPFAFLIILTGTIYKKVGEHLEPISPKSRTILRVIVVIWIIGAILNAIFFPNSDGFLGAIERSLTQVSETASGEPVACNSSTALARAKYSLENDPSLLYAVLQKRVKEFGPASEDYYDVGQKTRYCTAQAVVNGEKTQVSYYLYFDRDGRPQVRPQMGDNAFGKRHSQQTPPQDATNPETVAASQPALTEVQQPVEPPIAAEHIPASSKVPTCDNDEVSVMAASAYVEREGLTPSQIPVGVLAAFTSLEEQTQPEVIKLRQLVLDVGYVSSISDTRVCRASEGDPSGQGTVIFVRPDGRIGGLWMGLGEAIIYGE